MRNLRLLVTTNCHHNCEKCCNKLYDLNNLPIVQDFDYDNIVITGGEPLISTKTTNYIINLIEGIKIVNKTLQKRIPKFYIQTATRHEHLLERVLPSVDGITYTPHDEDELISAWAFGVNVRKSYKYNKKSLRLNIYPEIKEKMLPILKMTMYQSIHECWEVRYKEWLDECPLPEGEELKRISNLL